MEYKHQPQATRSWTTRRDEKKRRMQLVSSWMSGPLLPREKLVESLEALIAPRLRFFRIRRPAAVKQPLRMADEVRTLRHAF